MKIQPTVIFNIPFIQYSVEPFPNTIISLQNQMKIETIYPDSTNFISTEHWKKIENCFYSSMVNKFYSIPFENLDSSIYKTAIYSWEKC